MSDSPASPRAPLEIRGLVRRFRPDRPALLDGLELRLEPGEYVAIVGESGVGKSTLLNLIAGLDRPDAGTILIDGTDIGRLDDDAATLLRRERLGFVFQAFHVLPYLTVAQNVTLPLELIGTDPREREVRGAQLLEAVGLTGFGARRPRELSGGELQRVAIARALVHRPKLVLADEPTGNLDPRSAALVLALLRERIRAEGGAGILITHSATAAATADRVLELAGGVLQPRIAAASSGGGIAASSARGAAAV